MCEPPAVAMYYVSRLARQSVKVLISGEGGDEAFAGYEIYRNLLWLGRLRSTFGPLKGLASSSLMKLNRLVGSSAVAKFAPLLGLPSQSFDYGGHSHPVLDSNRPLNRLYTNEFKDQVDPEHTVAGWERWGKTAPKNDAINRMLYIDTKTWLVDDLLLKADKMTMANSIELRVPFLDHKVLEFAASLPGDYKVRGFKTKYLAKRALARQVPEPILNRRKVGFPVPYESWLRKDLGDWVKSILLDRRTLERGYFEKKAIEDLILRDSQSGGQSKDIFSLVALELWHRVFLETQSGSSIGVPLDSCPVAG